MPLRPTALALLLALSYGCGGRTNVLSTTQHITVAPVAGGSYTGYDTTTFSQSLPPNTPVHLLGVTASSSTGEFSWVSSLKVTAPDNPDVTIISKASFAEAQGSTDLDVVDTGDLRSLFPTGNSFRLDWFVAYASALAQPYPDGVTITVTYSFRLD
jgi:hypothetical protein